MLFAFFLNCCTLGQVRRNYHELHTTCLCCPAPYSQVRKILPRKDARGMTFLMHAASAGKYTGTLEPPSPSCSDHGDEDCQHAPTGLLGLASTEESLPTSYNCQDQDGPSGLRLCVDPRVPLMRSALNFAKKMLWMPEVWFDPARLISRLVAWCGCDFISYRRAAFGCSIIVRGRSYAAPQVHRSSPTIKLL